jgi:large subunit ribosomal protein L25
MKLLKLPVYARTKTGRGPARRLRSSSEIPAVIYGKSGVRHLTVKDPEFRLLMRAVAGTAALVEISDQAGGGTTLSLLQEIQRDARTDRFVHIDLKEVSPNEPMRAVVPIRIIGESIGVKLESGIIELTRHELHVKCLPKDLPDIIFIDVTELHANDSIHVRDIKPIPGVVFADRADEVVVACVIPAVEEVAVVEAVAVEGAAPADGAAPAEGAAPADGKAPAAGAKGAAPAAGAKGAAPAAGAKGAAPAAGAKGAAAPAAKGAAPAKPAGKK